MMLTQSEADKFWPIYDEYQKELKKLADRSIKLIETYASNYEAMTDEVAEQLVKEAMAIDEERIKLQKSYMPKFSKVMPAKKVARYYQLENKIDAVISFDLATQIPLVN